MPELGWIQNEYTVHMCDTIGKLAVEVRQRQIYCHPIEHDSGWVGMCLEYLGVNKGKNRIPWDG